MRTPRWAGHWRAVRRTVQLGLLAAVASTCDDPTGAGLEIRTSLNVSELLAASRTIPIPMDEIRVELRRASDSSTVVFDDRFPINDVLTDSGTVEIEITLVILQDPESFYLRLEVIGAGQVWYEVDATVTASAHVREPDVIPPPTYVGLGANADSVRISLVDTTITGGDSVLVRGMVFENNATIPGAPVSFVSSDPTAVQARQLGVDQAWLIAANDRTGNVTVTAYAPRRTDSLSTSGTIRFYAPASQIELVSGDGQIITTPGNDAANPLIVRVRDGTGQPFAMGYPVTFSVASGPPGTTVNPTVVTTDALGLAQTTLTAGSSSGPISVQASGQGLSGSPVTFNASVAGGGQATMMVFAGDDQTTEVGTPLPTAPAVRVLDSGGAPSAGVTVTFMVTQGGGSTTGGTVVTDTAGIATVGSWTLGQTTGTNALTATSSGLPDVVFFATATAGSPTQLAKISGDSQTANTGAALPNNLLVEVQDQFGNGVAGVTVNWVASDGSVSPMSSTTDGLGQAATSWTLGANQSTPTVTASALSLQPAVFMATTIFPAGTILLQLVGTNRVPLGSSADLEVTLTTAAPAGGVTVAVTSDNLAVVAVQLPGSVFIAQGATTGTVTLDGVAGGTTTVRANATGYTEKTLSVEVSVQVLSLPGTLNVPFGTARSIPVQISTPAPAGGEVITLVSNDPGLVSVLTPTVTIAEGQTTVNGQVSGVLPGTTTVTGTSTNYGTAQSTVSTTANLNIVQNSALLNPSFPTNVTVRLESSGSAIPAPSPGIPITLTSRDANCVSPSSPVTIVTGLTETNAVLSYGGVTTTPCSTFVVATAPNIAADSVNTTVNPAPSITVFNVIIGAGLQTNWNASLGATNHGGVTVSIVSDDPTVALVSPDVNTPGTDSIGVFVLDGSGFVPYYVQGVEGQISTIDVRVHAPGFANAQHTVDVRQPGVQIIALTATTTTLSPDDQFYVRVGYPNSLTNPTGLSAVRAVRAGAPDSLIATLTSSAPAIAQLVTTVPPQNGGTVTVGIQPLVANTPTSLATGGPGLEPLTQGVTTVQASIPGFVSVNSVDVTVSAPIISVFNATVGAGLQRNWSATLGATNHGGVDVSIVSDDPAVALISPDISTPGTDSIAVTIVNGQSVVPYYVQGVEGQVGSVNVRVHALGFLNNQHTTTIVQPGVQIIALATTATTLSTDDQFYVRVGWPNSPTNPTALTQVQAVRAGAPDSLVATLTSSALSVAQLITTNPAQSGASVSLGIPIQGFNSATTLGTGGTALQQLTPGITTVAASIPGYLPVNTVDVTITAPTISVSSPTVGAGLQRNWSATLGATNHGGVDVSIVSDDPAVALISPNISTPGTDSIVVTVPDGQNFVPYYVQGVEGQVGSVNVRIHASGFLNNQHTATIVQPGVQIIALATTTTTLSTDDQFYVRVGWPNSPTNPTTLSQVQAVRAGAPDSLVATLTSSAPTVAQLLTTLPAQGGASVTVGIPIQLSNSGTTLGTGGPALEPLTSGMTTVSAAIPGYLAVNPVDVTVSTPTITLFDVTVGAGLQESWSGTLGAPAPAGGVTVTLTSSAPSIALLSPDFSTAGTASIQIPVPQGSQFFTYYVQGVEDVIGTPSVQSTAPGYLDNTHTVTVVQPGYQIIGLLTSYTTASFDDAFYVRIGTPNSTTTPTFLTRVQELRSGAPASISFTIDNSVASVADLVLQVGVTQSAVAVILVGQQNTPTSVASGGVAFRPLTVGSTIVNAITASNFVALPSATVGVTVNP